MSEPTAYASRFATGSIVLSAVSGALWVLVSWVLGPNSAVESFAFWAAFISGVLAGLTAVAVTMFLLVRRRNLSLRIYIALVLGLTATGWCVFLYLWARSVAMAYECSFGGCT